MHIKCTLFWLIIVIISFISCGESLLAEVQGSISSYVWSNQGEFSLEGSHPSVRNKWDISHPIDCMMLSSNAYFLELKYNHKISLDVNYSSGIVKGHSRLFMVHDRNDYLTDLSYAEVLGQSRLSSVGLFYRLTGRDESNLLKVDVGFGYIGYVNSISYNNPKIVLDSADPNNSNNVFSERWEKYDLLYGGADLRIKGQLGLGGALSVSGMYGYSPSLSARYYYTKFPDRVATQKLKQSIDADGDGIQYAVFLNYDITRQFSAIIGYKYLCLRGKGGSYNDFYPFWRGGEYRLKTEMDGYIVGVVYHF